ncbi:MAG: DNA methyltransferase [Hyphomonadaceae bacterium]|nr:DNA methyltransferase [Hyphomonadaceae bacterium]
MQAIEHLPPAKLVPYKGNARTHSKRQITQIAKSIEAFGFNNPVLIDDHKVIIAGHGRVQAAKQLGLPTVPCIRLSHLNEAEKRAYVIADNQLATKAGWDRDIQALELQGLIDLGFDVTLTGFEVAEIDFILDAARAKETDDSEPYLPIAGPAITKRGDLWRLGEHRLCCADARDGETYVHLMGEERAEMVFTDPPYNVPVQGFVGGKGRIKHREFVEASGEMSEEEFIAFLTETLRLAADYSIDGSIHFVCMDWRHLYELSCAGRAVYDELKNVIVWAKDNAGMGTFYRSQHELLFAFKKGDAPHINSFELGQNGRSRSNVWRYAGINSMKADRMEELSMHPTVKPLAMVADAMRDCSKRKAIVLDPFAGSGTTVIAAEKTGRCARVIELDPLYCDVIVRRWQNFTGKHATLAASGATFEALEEAAGAQAQSA